VSGVFSPVNPSREKRACEILRRELGEDFLRLSRTRSAPSACAEAVSGPETEIGSVLLDAEPAFVESEQDEMLAVPDIVRKIIEAENDSVGVVIINCMGDPGLKPAWESVSFPVLGPAETTVHVASMLGHKVNVVTVLDSVLPILC
jgi:Asp/Glu/hydantoin racemase